MRCAALTRPDARRVPHSGSWPVKETSFPPHHIVPAARTPAVPPILQFHLAHFYIYRSGSPDTPAIIDSIFPRSSLLRCKSFFPPAAIVTCSQASFSRFHILCPLRPALCGATSLDNISTSIIFGPQACLPASACAVQTPLIIFVGPCLILPFHPPVSNLLPFFLHFEK